MAASKRSRQRFLEGAIAAAVLTAVVVLLLARTRGFRRLENITYDERTVLGAKPAEADKRIVIIDADNASVSLLQGDLGRWPWTRQVWTQVLWYISPGQPRAVLFDAIFSGAESDEVDKGFAQQIRASGNVVLGYTFNSSEAINNADSADREHKLKLLERESVPAAPGIVGVPVPGTISLNVPRDELANAALALGNVNASIDPDGVTRRTNLAVRFGDRSYPSLSARAADIVAHGGHVDLPQGFDRVGRYARHHGWTVPVDNDGNLLLRWHGGTYAYERIPIWQILCSMQPEHCDPAKVYYKPAYFKDRVVLIGASNTGSYEVRPTPFSETAPGFLSHATAIDNLLHHDGIAVAPGWFMPMAVIAAAAIGAAILLWIASVSSGAAVMLALLAAYALATYVAYGHWHLWLPFVAPAAALLVSYGSATGVRYATTGRELRKTRGTLNRYMAPQLVDYVLANVDNLQFQGEKRELTIFFSDVRNFTTLTEKSDPLVLISMLNEYLTEMTDVIFKYDGVVDKFIGDGILAYWGAFTPGNHALLGAQASLEMFDRLKSLNERWKQKGWPEIDIGVGLNTGDVIFGNVGAGKKIEFTVIGDPVNLASRLESENKPQHTHIIISEFTLAKLGEVAEVRPLGGVKVKGKTIETQIYELLGLKRKAVAPTVASAQAST